MAEAQKKRTSLVETHLADLQDQLRQKQNGQQTETARSGSTSSSVALEPPLIELVDTHAATQNNENASDISPALAYQPCKKSTTTTTTRVPSAGELERSAEEADEEQKQKRTPDVGMAAVPETDVLDSTFARSKVEAVKQSQVRPLCSPCARARWGRNRSALNFCFR